MKKRYIGIYAKNLSESHQFQNELFDKGFEWVNSGHQLVSANNFYARLEDMKIITCYHDPSIDEESVGMSLDDLKRWVVE